MTAEGTELPAVAISNGNVDMLRFLAELTGTRAVTTRRQYVKAG